MLSDLILSAEEGKPLWIPQLRELFSQDPSAVPLTLHLQLITGEWEVREFALPRWENAREKRFVQEYFYACIYNLLSACSGQRLFLDYDLKEEQPAELTATLDSVFQLREPTRRGYGKVINVANRLCAAFGLPPFRFCTGRPEMPVQVSPVCSGTDRRQNPSLCPHVACGVDIGGTDIKLALSVDGKLAAVSEYDWNPAQSPTAEGILNPILEQIELLRSRVPGKPLLDALGVSFPDIVIGDRILGGETPKTDGMRKNPALDYEWEFRKLSDLRELLRGQCCPQAPIRILNDGNMAAFTAANELSRPDLIAHTLGTDLGTGWLRPDGSIPQMPLELYDVILDLGSWPARDLPPQDLRSTRNENSGLPGCRRYLGQAAAFRLAWEFRPAMLESFLAESNGCLQIQTEPRDLRKPCLAHLMRHAGEGFAPAEEVFRQIGLHLGVLCREMTFLLRPRTEERYLYGRFFQNSRCFELIREGCAAFAPEYTLFAPDENTAVTPLMKQLAAWPGVTVAQYAQAIGAIYFASV